MFELAINGRGFPRRLVTKWTIIIEQGVYLPVLRLITYCQPFDEWRIIPEDSAALPSSGYHPMRTFPNQTPLPFIKRSKKLITNKMSVLFTKILPYSHRFVKSQLIPFIRAVEKFANKYGA